MASSTKMTVVFLINDSKAAYDWFLGSETISSILWRILRSLLIEVNKGLQFLNNIFRALLPIFLLIWFALWILDLEDLKGLQKYLKWWVLFCFVMIGVSQGLSALISAKIG